MGREPSSRCSNGKKVSNQAEFWPNRSQTSSNGFLWCIFKQGKGLVTLWWWFHGCPSTFVKKKWLVTGGEAHQNIAFWSQRRLLGRNPLAEISCPLSEGKISIVSAYGIISSTSAKWLVFDRAGVLFTVSWRKNVSKQAQFCLDWNWTTSHDFL
jgi:hypothetical protein